MLNGKRHSRIHISTHGEHQKVPEYVLEGEDEVWRKSAGTEDTIHVSAGTSLTIPLRTAFQFRNTGTGPLCILIVTMPPWPGSQEAEKAVGVWLATGAAIKELIGEGP